MSQVDPAWHVLAVAEAPQLPGPTVGCTQAVHETPLPQYSALHVHVMSSEVLPGGQEPVCVAWASHTVQGVQVTPSP